MRHLMIAFFLTACGTDAVSEKSGIPYRGSITLDISASWYEDPVMTAAAFVEDETGMSLSSRDIVVRTQLQAIDCGGAIVGGCSHNYRPGHKSEVIVTYDSHGCFAETYIAHEFGHVARYAEIGDADGTHSDKEFWTEIGRAERRLLNKYCPRSW